MVYIEARPPLVTEGVHTFKTKYKYEKFAEGTWSGQILLVNLAY